MFVRRRCGPRRSLGPWRALRSRWGGSMRRGYPRCRIGPRSGLASRGFRPSLIIWLGQVGMRCVRRARHRRRPRRSLYLGRGFLVRCLWWTRYAVLRGCRPAFSRCRASDIVSIPRSWNRIVGSGLLSAASRRSLVRGSGLFSSYHPAATELSRFCSCGNCGPPVIYRCEQLAVAGGRGFVPGLHGCGCDMFLAGCCLFSRCGPGSDAPGSAVVRHMVHRGVVDHRGVVHVGHVGGVYIVHTAVIKEPAVPPVAALVSHAAITVAIVNASIEPDRRPPEAGMPEERGAAPAPITWRPKQTGLRRHHPSAGNPEVALGAVGPISRRPQITWGRAGGLRINRQRGRSKADRNKHAGK